MDWVATTVALAWLTCDVQDEDLSLTWAESKCAFGETDALHGISPNDGRKLRLQLLDPFRWQDNGNAALGALHMWTTGRIDERLHWRRLTFEMRGGARLAG